MGKSATVTSNSERGFSLVEAFIAIVLLVLIAIALLNVSVLFLKKRLLVSLDNWMVDAAGELSSHPAKVLACQNVGACEAFRRPDCENSLSCNRDLCYDENACVACSVDPDTGNAFFYSFNSTVLSAGNRTVVKVTLCRLYGNQTKTKDFVIKLSGS